jgi:dTDP-4-amino-4,6-dideoxy-D-galactose acyltransferase
MIGQLLYKKLEWDSQTFGIPTATINVTDLPEGALGAVLSEIKTEGFRLVYFPAQKPLSDICLLRSFDGMLADEKLTFVKKLDSAYDIAEDPHIHSYALPFVSEDLLQLALDSGLYSRFKVDPHFVHNEYQKLYRIWIEKSVRKEIAQEILVYEDQDRILGMVTLGEKNGRGDIGLVAVSGLARGQGIGKKMMAAAEAYFRKKGYQEIQVVTQGINEAAVKLYTGSGFHLDKKLYYYHFWL